MNTMTLDCWRRAEGAESSAPVGKISFRVSETAHLQLEQAEEDLRDTPKQDYMLSMDLADMELEPPVDCGPLSDCQLRVYLRNDDLRGQFHLVGHSARDGSLIYSNAVMVDQLG